MSITTNPTKVLAVDDGGYYEKKEQSVVTPTNDKIIAGTGLSGNMFGDPIASQKKIIKELSDDGGTEFIGGGTGGTGDTGGSGGDGGSGGEGGEGGTGVESVLGTPDFTWQQEASKRAGIQLGKDVEDTRKDFLQQRQQIDQAGQQAQEEYSMSKYSTNQSIEKAGWAGGYVLDAQRQQEYLKASIQAQMYGQMELQKMGYDSQLAAARLAHDLGKQDLARQYYQDAVANQVQKAQLTGIWISPEVNDMLTQSQAASAILAKKEGLSDEEKLLDKEYQQARHLKDQVINWFAETGLSETGVDTLAKMTFDLDVQAFNESKIQAALEAMEPGQYVKKNADGSYKIDEATGRPEIIDLTVATPEEQWNFFNTDYGHIALRNQVNNLAAQTMQNFVNNTDGLADMTDKQVAQAFATYLSKGSNDLVKDYVNQFGSNDIMQRLIDTHPEAFVDGQYSYSYKSGDQTYTYRFDQTIEPKPGAGGGAGPGAGPIDFKDNPEFLSIVVNPEVHYNPATTSMSDAGIKVSYKYYGNPWTALPAIIEEGLIDDSKGTYIKFDGGPYNKDTTVFVKDGLVYQAYGERNEDYDYVDLGHINDPRTDHILHFAQGYLQSLKGGGIDPTSAELDAFGKFEDWNKQESGQYKYTLKVLDIAKQGIIPNGATFKMNYGGVDQDPGIYTYYDGKFYPSYVYDDDYIGKISSFPEKMAKNMNIITDKTIQDYINTWVK